jgi:hypothetical protein
MQKINKEFYENLSGQKLSDQEAFEAKQNFVGFFDLLLKIDKRNDEQNNRDSNSSSEAK